MWELDFDDDEQQLFSKDELNLDNELSKQEVDYEIRESIDELEGLNYQFQ